MNYKLIEEKMDSLFANLGTASHADLLDYHSMTGKLLADVEYDLNLQKSEALRELLSDKPNMAPNEQKTLVDGKCAYLIKVFRKVEKANKSVAVRLHTKD